MTITSQAQPLTLAGKVAIVTGGSRGIGAASAIEFAKRGANVAITFVSPSSAKLADDVISTIAALPNTNGARAIKIHADTCDPASPAKIVAETTAAFGTQTIDILVNNAGAETLAPLGQITHEQFTHAFDTNVRGVVFTTQAVLPHLPPASTTAGGRTTGGRIINVGSVLGRVGNPGGSVYAATKAAMEGLTRCWAHDLGAAGHTVNVVAPAMTETDMMRRTVGRGVPREQLDAARAMTPMQRRLAEPEDVALVVAMLAEDGSRWVTGQTIQAGGGIHMA
ncbi:hypothetical protein SLS58_004443 [Diplodia intermedia]|uniref:Ketoreductase domain-containing protein n=1 Tax=Diplodia intermedia TaxID=856260 RepID=A0ABR3TU18_9PEZI